MPGKSGYRTFDIPGLHFSDYRVNQGLDSQSFSSLPYRLRMPRHSGGMVAALCLRSWPLLMAVLSELQPVLIAVVICT